MLLKGFYGLGKKYDEFPINQFAKIELDSMDSVRGGGGGGQATRSGTEKRCSHNLQSGQSAG